MNIKEDVCLHILKWFVFLGQITNELVNQRVYFYVSWHVIFSFPNLVLDFISLQIIVTTGSQYLFMRIVN